MKCSKCGYNARTIKAMGEHYRKKHPRSMKKKATAHRRGSYCPTCGRKR